MLEQERFEEFSSLISGIYGSIQKLKARYTAQLGLKAVHVFWIYLLREHPEGMSRGGNWRTSSRLWPRRSRIR